MAGMEWTREQKKVIEVRDRNVLVSAAAGSGKTAVLVERILSMISNPDKPVDIDRLLVVTFTNAAAEQMRERIERAVSERADAMPGNFHLQKQKNLVHGARITTIHSFCMSVLRNYFSLINLEPGFRVGEEAELSMLKSDTAGELLEEKYKEAEEGFLAFIEFYSTGKSDKRLAELLLQIHDFAVGYPWPEEWLRERKKDFSITGAEDMERTEWMGELLRYVRFTLEGLKERLAKAKRLCLMEHGPAVYLDALLADEDILAGLLKASSYRAYYDRFTELAFTKLRPVSKKDEISEELKEKVQEIRKELKKSIEDIRKAFFFQSPEQMAEDLKRVSPVMEELTNLCLAFGEAYQRRKEEARLLDYSDLEHKALAILVKRGEDGKPQPTAAAKELSQYYVEILIDEYQDSNLVQELLLNSISREADGKPNVFMVGDVKQSIYKFRLARPELFMDKFCKYRKWEDGDSPYQRIDLHRNFRSRTEVVDCVNFLFRQMMQRELGSITYNEEAALYAGASFPETDENAARGMECMFLSPPEEAQEVRNVRQLEAEAVAVRIQRLLSPEEGVSVYDAAKGEYRSARCEDIVILLRTMAGWAEEFAEVLNARGIPAYTDTRTGYFAALEVSTVLNLLKIIDNPRQDIPLAAVLHSPIGGFDAGELAKIRGEFSGAEFYDALTAYQRDGKEEHLREKTSGFLERLFKYRSMVPYTEIHRLLQYVMEDTGYYDYVSVMPAGERRQANLSMLVKKAEEFEATSYRGLFDFNRYMERLHKYEIDFGEASPGNGGVRIMSIHKSKGLEFPIVIAAGLGKSFNVQDSRSRIVLHPDLGIGPDFVDSSLRVKAPTLLKKVIQKKLVLENLGEELRVLYVAFTRAKEQLILSGVLPDREKTEAVWREEAERETEALPYRLLAGAKCALDFIGPCLYYPGGPPYSVRYMEGEELLGREIKRQLVQTARKQTLLHWDAGRVYDAGFQEKIREAFSFRYPYEKERGYAAKMTVTELKKLSMADEESAELYGPGGTREKREASGAGEAPVPRFLSGERKDTAAGRGSLYHRIMECAELTALLAGRTAEEELLRLAAEGKLTEEERKSIYVQRLERFLETELAGRMAKAQAEGRLRREQKFVMGLSPDRIYPSAGKEGLILVQGMIDAFFEEGDGLVLVDYKTDRVDAGEEERLAGRYRIQFDYYEEALSRMAGRSVSERWLYSFSLGKAIPVL